MAMSLKNMLQKIREYEPERITPDILDDKDVKDVLRGYYITKNTVDAITAGNKIRALKVVVYVFYDYELLNNLNNLAKELNAGVSISGRDMRKLYRCFRI